MFEEIKNKITEKLVLALLQRKGKYYIETNISGYTIGGVLSQLQAENKWKPVVFLSRMMSPIEKNYKIYDKELLAIVECLIKWRPYLLDVEETFKIWMDHNNL